MRHVEQSQLAPNEEQAMDGLIGWNIFQTKIYV